MSPWGAIRTSSAVTNQARGLLWGLLSGTNSRFAAVHGRAAWQCAGQCLLPHGLPGGPHRELPLAGLLGGSRGFAAGPLPQHTELSMPALSPTMSQVQDLPNRVASTGSPQPCRRYRISPTASQIQGLPNHLAGTFCMCIAALPLAGTGTSQPPGRYRGSPQPCRRYNLHVQCRTPVSHVLRTLLHVECHKRGMTPGRTGMVKFHFSPTPLAWAASGLRVMTTCRPRRHFRHHAF